MKITVFTSNLTRHLSLIENLANVADTVYAVQECLTVFPGRVANFYRKSPVMQEYFGHVIEAERQVFGSLRFLPGNVRQLALIDGDLNLMAPDLLSTALQSDVIVVYGASYIRDPLCGMLVERRAVNIHMGVSPYYRGANCNFWAMYDDRPDMVGATIHLLSKGLDAGAMLFHAFPQPASREPFIYGMECVRAAHQALCKTIADGSLWKMEPVPQDRSAEIRFSRNAEFTDEVAQEYLGRLQSPSLMREKLLQRDANQFLRSVFV
jgi:hypothetical protein